RRRGRRTLCPLPTRAIAAAGTVKRSALPCWWTSSLSFAVSNRAATILSWHPGSVVGGFQSPSAIPPDVSLADRLAHRRSEPSRAPATGADGPMEFAIADRLQGAEVADAALELLGRGFGWDIMWGHRRPGGIDTCRARARSQPRTRGRHPVRDRSPLRLPAGSLLTVGDLILGVLGGQGFRDVFEIGPFGLDPEQQLGHTAECHHSGADAEGQGHQRSVLGFDHPAEQQRSGDAAGRRADRIEERDRQRPGLHREDLADREIGGAGARGGEEEADDEDDEEQPFTTDVGAEYHGQDDGDGSRTEIAERDHRFASDRVEEPTEDDRA